MSKKKYNYPVQFYQVPNTTNVFGGTDGGASDDAGSMVYDTSLKFMTFFDGTTWNHMPSDRVVSLTITGATTIDLSLGTIFLLTMSGNVTNFDFSNEIVGRQYLFVFLKSTTEKTITWQTGKYRFSYGTVPVLTNPTTNGTTPAYSRDIITALCLTSGRLDVVTTANMLDN